MDASASATAVDTSLKELKPPQDLVSAYRVFTEHRDEIAGRRIAGWTSVVLTVLGVLLAVCNAWLESRGAFAEVFTMWLVCTILALGVFVFMHSKLPDLRSYGGLKGLRRYVELLHALDLYAELCSRYRGPLDGRCCGLKPAAGFLQDCIKRLTDLADGKRGSFDSYLRLARHVLDEARVDIEAGGRTGAA